MRRVEPEAVQSDDGCRSTASRQPARASWPIREGDGATAVRDLKTLESAESFSMSTRFEKIWRRWSPTRTSRNEHLTRHSTAYGAWPRSGDPREQYEGATEIKHLETHAHRA